MCMLKDVLIASSTSKVEQRIFHFFLISCKHMFFYVKNIITFTFKIYLMF